MPFTCIGFAPRRSKAGEDPRHCKQGVWSPLRLLGSPFSGCPMYGHSFSMLEVLVPTCADEVFQPKDSWPSLVRSKDIRMEFRLGLASYLSGRSPGPACHRWCCTYRGDHGRKKRRTQAGTR